jgi:hypothetical protein
MAVGRDHQVMLAEEETLHTPLISLGLFVIFGEQGTGLLPATLGVGSNWTRWRLLGHLLPLYPAPAAWRLSQLALRITKSDDDPTLIENNPKTSDRTHMP